MSALGQMRTFRAALGMSALPPKADLGPPVIFPINPVPEHRRCGSPGQCVSSSRRDATGVPPFPIAPCLRYAGCWFGNRKDPPRGIVLSVSSHIHVQKILYQKILLSAFLMCCPALSLPAQ